MCIRDSYSVKLATQRKSLTHYTKGTQSPQLNRSSRSAHGSASSLGSFAALRASKNQVEGRLSWGSHCLYACDFRIYFTPLPGFFSPFPHGTGSLSVDYEYLALEDGPPIFRQDFTCPALLVSALVLLAHRLKTARLFRGRSPLLAESRLISVPPATEMFQFTGFALSTL